MRDMFVITLKNNISEVSVFGIYNDYKIAIKNSFILDQELRKDKNNMTEYIGGSIKYVMPKFDIRIHKSNMNQSLNSFNFSETYIAEITSLCINGEIYTVDNFIDRVIRIRPVAVKTSSFGVFLFDYLIDYVKRLFKSRTGG